MAPGTLSGQRTLSKWRDAAGENQRFHTCKSIALSNLSFHLIVALSLALCYNKDDTGQLKHFTHQEDKIPWNDGV